MRLGVGRQVGWPNSELIYVSGPGEQAAAGKILYPLWEAVPGGEAVQETPLQGGGEEGLDTPHATLPGFLL